MKVLIADGVSQMAVDILKDDFECVIKDKLRLFRSLML